MTDLKRFKNEQAAAKYVEIILEICDLNWICPTLYFAPFRLYECGSAGWLVACNLILSLLHFVSKKEKKTFEKKRHFAVAAKSLVAEKGL